MSLEHIHIHDSVLERVEENTLTHELLFHVLYPVNWQANVYARRILAFGDVLHYRVDEGSIVGAPTLLDYETTAAEDGRTRVEFFSNAGKRSLLYRSVELRLAPGESGPLDLNSGDDEAGGVGTLA